MESLFRIFKYFVLALTIIGAIFISYDLIFSSPNWQGYTSITVAILLGFVYIIFGTLFLIRYLSNKYNQKNIKVDDSKKILVSDIIAKFILLIIFLSLLYINYKKIDILPYIGSIVETGFKILF